MDLQNIERIEVVVDDDDDFENFIDVDEDDDDSEDRIPSELLDIEHLDNRYQRFRRIARVITTIFFMAIVYIYIVSIGYLLSYNLYLVYHHCPYGWTEVVIGIFMLMGIMAVILVIKLKSYITLWCFHLVLLFLAINRVWMVERYSSFELTDEEIDFYARFQHKLFALGECMIGLKVWLGVVYVLNLLGFIILICGSLLPCFYKIYQCILNRCVRRK